MVTFCLLTRILVRLLGNTSVGSGVYLEIETGPTFSWNSFCLRNWGLRWDRGIGWLASFALHRGGRTPFTAGDALSWTFRREAIITITGVAPIPESSAAIKPIQCSAAPSHHVHVRMKLAPLPPPTRPLFLRFFIHHTRLLLLTAPQGSKRSPGEPHPRKIPAIFAWSPPRP